MQFLNGLMAKAPNPKTPWIKSKLSIKREELIKTLSEMEGEWVNANVCESKKDTSKWYVAIDDWKPENKAGTTNQEEIDNLTF